MNLCKAKDCKTLARAKGLCNTHYGRWIRHGSTDSKYRERKPKCATIEERLLASREIVDGHWIWKEYINKQGYGGLTYNGRYRGVHRWSYLTFVGEIPPGITVDHMCRVRSCYNPDHLQLVTPAENIRLGNGYGGINYRKKSCIYGHPFDENNTLIRGNGRRMCRECTKKWNRISRMRLKEKQPSTERNNK